MLYPADILIIATVVIVTLLLLIFLVVVYSQTRKIQDNVKDHARVLDGIVQAFQNEQTQLSLLSEKISHMEPVTQNMSNLQSDFRGLSERILTVENNQNKVYEGVGYLANNSLSSLTELKTLTGSLTESTEAIRSELSRAKDNLSELRAHARSDWGSEHQIANSVRRLETIFAGTQAPGMQDGELLEAVFAKLPQEWQVRDFQLGEETVEFGLRLPNGQILPIDGRWTGTDLLDELVAAEDFEEQERIKKEIEQAVLDKARQVEKYIDPEAAVDFGLAVIPDAIFDLCASVQADAFQFNVVLLSYSMFVPYLLLVFQSALRSSQSVDLQKFETHIQSAREEIDSLQGEIDGRFSEAITQLSNARDDMRVNLGKLRTGLTSLQVQEAEKLPSPTSSSSDTEEIPVEKEVRLRDTKEFFR